MPHPSHILGRNGWHYIRFRIPQDITPLLGRKVICKPLKTQNKKAARNLLTIYMAQANNIFLLARACILNTQAQKAIEHHTTNFLQVCEFLKGTDDNIPMQAPAQSELTLMVSKYQQALAQQDYSSIAGKVSLLCEGACKILCVNGRNRLQPPTTGGTDGHTRRPARYPDEGLQES